MSERIYYECAELVPPSGALTSEQLDELERKAKEATPGPWFHAYARVVSQPVSAEYSRLEALIPSDATDDDPRWSALPDPDVCHVTPSYGDTCVGQNQKDALHIAANSPDVTLRLVAVYRAALAWSECRCESNCTGWFHALACQERRSNADVALLAALRKGTP